MTDENVIRSLVKTGAASLALDGASLLVEDDEGAFYEVERVRLIGARTKDPGMIIRIKRITP